MDTLRNPRMSDDVLGFDGDCSVGCLSSRVLFCDLVVFRDGELIVNWEQTKRRGKEQEFGQLREPGQEQWAVQWCENRSERFINSVSVTSSVQASRQGTFSEQLAGKLGRGAQLGS